MEEKLWTVARFPSGDWTYGGKKTDPAYSDCEIYQISAVTPKDAVKKAQAQRRKDVKRAEANEAESTENAQSS
ncbi:hypothetical protein [Burkholderia contaminans]|uniref:hypothetical protein n=1 Tax=Burkholderia contaminans TaxID=488447 RepID=UPI000CFE36B4|nr:hypothetical protein [Burkholderia contaminans]PRD92288.1 hypothetical protein C6P88_16660 [Burkholderia contaminans]